MHAIAADTKIINDVTVRTYKRNVKRAKTDLIVEAGTTGFRGYVPREKSARAFLALDCRKGDFHFEPVLDEEGKLCGVVIACCGDVALMSLMESLDFAMEALTDGCE